MESMKCKSEIMDASGAGAKAKMESTMRMECLCFTPLAAPVGWLLLLLAAGVMRRYFLRMATSCRQSKEKRMQWEIARVKVHVCTRTRRI